MALRLWRDLMDDFDTMRPTRILDQHFGLGFTPDDLLHSAMVHPHRHPLIPRNYYRPWRVDTQDTGSTVQCDKERFQVNLDVQQFKPEEIQVKVVDDSVVVEGKHEEKQDEHGYISRHFVRKYMVPKEYKVDDIASSLSSDGVLTICAPRAAAIENKENVVPIIHTGPHKAVKEAEKENKS